MTAPFATERKDDALAATSGLLFAAIGLVEGLVWWQVGALALEAVRSERLPMAVVFLTSTAALVGRFTWTGAAIRRWAWLSVAPETAPAAVAPAARPGPGRCVGRTRALQARALPSTPAAPDLDNICSCTDSWRFEMPALAIALGVEFGERRHAAAGRGQRQSVR